MAEKKVIINKPIRVTSLGKLYDQVGSYEFLPVNVVDTILAVDKTALTVIEDVVIEEDEKVEEPTEEIIEEPIKTPIEEPVVETPIEEPVVEEKVEGAKKTTRKSGKDEK